MVRVKFRATEKSAFTDFRNAPGRSFRVYWQHTGSIVMDRERALKQLQTLSGFSRTELCFALGYSGSTTPLLSWLRTGSPAFQAKLGAWLSKMPFPEAPSLQADFPQLFAATEPEDRPSSGTRRPYPNSVDHLTLQFPVSSAKIVHYKGNLFLSKRNCLSQDLSFEYPLWSANRQPDGLNLQHQQGLWTFKMDTSTRIQVTLESDQDIGLLKAAICSLLPTAVLDDGPVVHILTLPTFRRVTHAELDHLRGFCSCKAHLSILLLSAGNGELNKSLSYPELSDVLVELTFSGQIPAGNHLVKLLGLLASPRPATRLARRKTLTIPQISFETPRWSFSEWTWIIGATMLVTKKDVFLASWGPTAAPCIRVKDPAAWPPPGILLNEAAGFLTHLRPGSLDSSSQVWADRARRLLFFLQVGLPSENLPKKPLNVLRSEVENIDREICDLCYVALDSSAQSPPGWELVVVR